MEPGTSEMATARSTSEVVNINPLIINYIEIVASNLFIVYYSSKIENVNSLS